MADFVLEMGLCFKGVNSHTQSKHLFLVWFPINTPKHLSAAKYGRQYVVGNRLNGILDVVVWQ